MKINCKIKKHLNTYINMNLLEKFMLNTPILHCYVLKITP